MPADCRCGPTACDFADPGAHADPLLGLFWPAADDPAILPVRASAAPRPGPDTFDLLKLPVAATILREGARERAVIADGPRHLRLETSGDSLTRGPVRLHYDLTDFHRLRARLLTLHRLEAVVRLGRLPTGLYERDPLALRWMNALAAWTMKQEGASQIEIAISLFGAASVDSESMERMRKRVARLLDLATRRIALAHRRFLGTAPEPSISAEQDRA
ncbi:DUF2285 domain-containing protein [Sphingomonas sp. Leaf21]|uniref:DUF2285 domain-containing protein n=1 Tax=Sphingomonas sp. Leaf21 TaxID=2876550 RepID=UPI001E358AF2|nr:DUF2285 domain-containing protein [Sphingomonas sp. Leaf21]